jgi:hypothetical protein
MKIIRLAQEAVLENSEEAEKYALENIDSVQEAFEKKEEGDSSSYNYYLEEIEEYVDIYHGAKRKNEIEIYRALVLNSADDLDLNNIGKHWSFKKEGAGVYGGGHPMAGMFKDGRSFLLTGIVNFKDIDWLYGFHSYVWYGESQSECALKEGAIIKVIAIDDQQLDNPIIGAVGKH